MKAPFWLAWRELVNRKPAFITGVGMVAAAVALCAATELVSRAKEAAIGAQIDHIGPALRLIPAGKTASDLARFELGSDRFTKKDVAKISGELSRWIRTLEGRLLLKVPIEGGAVAGIGVDPDRVVSPFDVLGRLGDDDVALGIELARRLGKKAGSEIRIKGEEHRVVAVLPETASVEDVAIFLPLGRLQGLFGLPAGTVNEMRIFPSPGAGVEEIVASLKRKHAEVNVINLYRGDTAEQEMGHGLSQRRQALYAITAIVIAFCILVWSYLNASERQLEMATVVAIGGTGLTVLFMFLIRATIVGFFGGVVGYLAGAVISLSLDWESALGVVLSWQLLLVLCGGAAVLSAFGALIASIFSAFREHVKVLQEW